MSDPKNGGAFAPISGNQQSKPPSQKDVWQIILPVPDDAPPAPEQLYDGQKPSQKWAYKNANGNLVGWIYRFEKDGGKDFRPLTYCQNHKTKKAEWRWKSWPAPRPLYNADRLAQLPTAKVLVVEGEKCADAARILEPKFVTITSSGGSKAASKADWSELGDRDVIIWPDHDKAGAHYAETVTEMAENVGVKSIAIITPPSEKSQGWDIADAIDNDWTIEQLQNLINSAENAQVSEETPPSDSSAANNSEEGKNPKKPKRTPKSEDAIKLLDGCEFWHDEKDQAFATFYFRNRIEHSRIRDQAFKIFVSILYFETTGGSLSATAEEEVYRTLSARAVAQGRCCRTWNRTAFDGDYIVIDLANEKGEMVNITKDGWEIITSEDIKFLRPDTSLAMPNPIKDTCDESSINLLRQYCNVENESEFTLAIAWIMGAFRPRGPYTILTVTGEMGSGKSFFSELIASIVDPQSSKRVSLPGDERDLFILGNHQHTLLFDNLSGVSRSLSDSLCRLSTGGAVAARKLHSDGELVTIRAQNPIVLNGIPDLSKQSDLADRSIPMQLKTLEGAGRMTEEDLNNNLKKDMPKILGALFDGLSAGLRNWETTKLKKPPRMADFARWVEACSSGLGWAPGEFLQAYQENREAAYAISFESDAVAQPVKDWMDETHPTGWKGKPAYLYSNLCAFVSDAKKKEPGWPKSASGLGAAMKRIAPIMRKNGYNITNGKSGERYISIQPVE